MPLELRITELLVSTIEITEVSVFFTDGWQHCIYVYMPGFVYEKCMKFYTVNVKIFAQYLFSRISRRALDTRKFYASENYNHNKTNGNKQHMRENLTARLCLIGLDAKN